MKKVLIIYPPTKNIYQRGEDRCQIDILSSTVNSMRACNDLMYISSILKKEGYNPIIKDYQAEKKKLKDLLDDVSSLSPDVLFISTTNGSIYQDLDVISKIKKIKNDITIVLKGAIFFNIDNNLFENVDFSDVDYLIGGEVEFIIADLLNYHFKDKTKLSTIEGISYKEANKWIINPVINFKEDLNSLPFPDRSAINNALYKNPETNKPMALITTAKGCCFSCTYCLSPIISGKKIRERSVQNIFNEIEECITKYNITNFFFKSDTFTANKKLVIELCNQLIASGYNKKINWVATSRVDTIDEELIEIMQKAGCSLLAIGFESGSNESLQKMRKNTTVEQNIEAIKMCKKHNLKVLGYFLIGFEWENKQHLAAIEKHIFEIDPDYIEISIVVPFAKTPLYEEYIANNKQIDSILGKDSYNKIMENYSQFTSTELKNFRKRILLKFYFRPKYIFKKLLQIKSFSVLKNYMEYGLRVLKNTLFTIKK